MRRFGKKVKNGSFWESLEQNRESYMLYFNRFLELSISMFEWKNIPDSIDPRFLELALFYDGMAVWFKDEELGDYLCLQCMIGGDLDHYRIPKIRNAYAVNGYHKTLDEKNSVIIFNNMIHTNSALQVLAAAERLWDYDRIIDVNVRTQKTPVLIRCDETQRLTMKNVYKKFDGNEPAIFADKNFRPDDVSVLKTDAPFIADKVYTLKTQYWNETLTYLGISNVSFQKKERIISDEAIRQSGGTIASRYSRLNARRQACDQINKMFGLNIECDFREDYRTVDDEFMQPGDTQGEELGKGTTGGLDLVTVNPHTMMK